jgi:hypothetical protein
MRYSTSYIHVVVGNCSMRYSTSYIHVVVGNRSMRRLESPTLGTLPPAWPRPVSRPLRGLTFSM